MSALATVVPKSFSSKFSAKIDFSDRAFYVTVADADIGSLMSLHTLLEKYLVKYEQIWMVRTVKNVVLLNKNSGAYLGGGGGFGGPGPPGSPKGRQKERKKGKGKKERGEKRKKRKRRGKREKGR